jgi:hypothetical protein
MSERVWDFRREGGKKPRVRRGMRAISTDSGMWGRETKYSCLYSGSASGVGVGKTEGDALAEGRSVWLLKVCVDCSEREELGFL